MAYIANKPVRFDRDYAIGEVIPDEVIDTKMEKRLIDWGKIIKVTLPNEIPAQKVDIDASIGNDIDPNSKKEGGGENDRK